MCMEVLYGIWALSGKSSHPVGTLLFGDLTFRAAKCIRATQTFENRKNREKRKNRKNHEKRKNRENRKTFAFTCVGA